MTRGDFNMDNTLSTLELEKRMRPGAYSQKGFLGQTESLEAVLAHDSRLLSTLGISYAQIASALEKVLQSVQDQSHMLMMSHSSEWEQRESVRIPNLYQPESVPHFTAANLPGIDVGYLVGDKYQVFIMLYRGLQECPWGCERHEYGSWSGFDFLLLNRKSGKYVTGPGLIVHLTRKHHFFEGLESPYRVDPAKLVEVLELDFSDGSGVD